MTYVQYHLFRRLTTNSDTYEKDITHKKWEMGFKLAIAIRSIHLKLHTLRSGRVARRATGLG